MIRIKISYNTEDELAALVSSLPPKVKSVKRQPAKGRYMRAYVDIDLLPFPISPLLERKNRCNNDS